MNSTQDITSLGRQLEVHAQTQPSALALLAPGHSAVSYAPLFGAVQRMGPWLSAHGLGPRSRIALLMPSGMPLAIATLGIGCLATAIPLNPALTEPELRTLLSEAQADALVALAGSSLAERLAQQLGLAHLAFDLDAHLAGPRGPLLEAHTTWPWPEPADTAFVLFTSGTTGQPKRVPLKHGQILHSARNIGRHFELTRADRNLLVMPLHHSQGLIVGLTTPLVAGASVVCTPGFGMPDFLDWVAQFKPSWYSASPTIHQAVASQPEDYRARCSGHTFRFVRSGASVLPISTIDDLEALTGAPLIETYGMTESATHMTSNPMPPGLRKHGTVGRASGCELRILGKSGHFLVAGQIGEIAVRGPTIFGGYESPAPDNAEHFQQGWFRTGDLGVLDPDGYLTIVGRLNELINRGGEKIAPSDVEQALLRLPGVVQAVAFPAPHPTLGQDVHAAVVLAKDARLEPPAVRALLFGVIADFKIPARVHVLDSIPVGAGGKVQRRGLHDQLAPIDRVPQATAPLTPLQARIAAIFVQILRGPVPDRDANFLALGGDSLSALRLVQSVNQACGVDLAPWTVLAEPTLGAFADLVQAAIDEADALILAEHAEAGRMIDNQVIRPQG